MLSTATGPSRPKSNTFPFKDPRRFQLRAPWIRMWAATIDFMSQHHMSDFQVGKCDPS